MMHLYTDNQRQYILLGAKQLYFNRFAANCNPMYIRMIYPRGLDYTKEHSFKQVYFAPARESSLFMTHKLLTR
jgi:hypothetical protein